MWHPVAMLEKWGNSFKAIMLASSLSNLNRMLRDIFLGGSTGTKTKFEFPGAT